MGLAKDTQSLTKVGERVSSQDVHRIYYTDDSGRLVEKLVNDESRWQKLAEQNQDYAQDHKLASNGGIRKVAEIPNTIYTQWLMEEGIDTYADDKALDVVINKKLNQPENRYLWTVPQTYRMMRYGN